MHAISEGIAERGGVFAVRELGRGGRSLCGAERNGGRRWQHFAPWDLQTALSQPSSVVPGDTIWLRGGVYRAPSSNGFDSKLNGTAGSPIIVRNYNGERATIDGRGTEFSLAVDGSYTWFWGLEVMDSNTNRSASGPGSDLHPNAFG